MKTSSLSRVQQRAYMLLKWTVCSDTFNYKGCVYMDNLITWDANYIGSNF